MIFIVDMGMLLKFCPFHGANASVTFDGTEVVIAFEWKNPSGDFSRLVRILNIQQMGMSTIGVEKCLDVELHKMRHEMELVRNNYQPV